MSRTGVMLQMVKSACLEMTPAPGVLERLDCVPRHSFLTITCSPTHGLAPTLDLMDTLNSQTDPGHFKLIPHIAARMVRDRGHLAEIIARLHDAKIECIFVPGGDAPEPAGDFENSLDLLRAMAELGHHIPDVGVAAHPEGHPMIADVPLLQALLDKQQFATYFVTQMCFDVPALVAWLGHVRSAGVTMPAWIGLPGVADLGKLLKRRDTYLTGSRPNLPE